MIRIRSAFALAFAAVTPLLAQTPKPALPSEMPATFTPVRTSFDYDRREVNIPMRDGVKLHTVILVPKGAKNAGILITRTPYDADGMTRPVSPHLAPVLEGYDNATDVIVEGGYIRVIQDVRGKHGSEGDYVMNRPLRGPLNPTNVDHATDTYDTIDWLVKNVPESNGKVGILGISYDGFTPLMALFNPHPALKVSVPMNPMVDGWMGDDWFHNGAFRQLGAQYIYEQEANRKNDEKWWNDHFDDYDTFMTFVSAGELGRSRGMDVLGFWRKLTEHPVYDAFWQNQALDKLLAKEPLKVPVMLVAGLWDQEDIYGAPAVYKAIVPKDSGKDKVFLVLGPWYHGQEIDDGSALGPIKFDSDTAKTFRREVLAPFLAQYLKDGAPKADIARVTAFETGTNVWRRLDGWPAGCAAGCAIKASPLFLAANGKAAFAAPATGDAVAAEYVSDPARPGAVQGPALDPRELRRKRELADVARHRSARRVRTARRRRVHDGCPDRARQDQRPADRAPRRFDLGHRCRLGRQSDRRLSRSGRVAAGARRISARRFDGHLPRALSREHRDAETARRQSAARLPVGAAEREPRLPAGAPDHGAGAVELVSALRPQPADLRAQHLLGEAGGLPEGDAADLRKELHRAARGHVAVAST